MNDFAFLVAIENARALRGDFRMGHSTGKVLFLRRELGMLEETLGRAYRSFPMWDRHVRIKEEFGKPTAIFRSGFKCIFGGCKDPKDWIQYETAEYVRIYYDELGQFEEEQYHQINSRCRSSDPVLMQFVGIRAATNPTANWVRKRFYDPAPKGRVVLRRRAISPMTGDTVYRTCYFLPALLKDNPNRAFALEYERNLLFEPPSVRNAKLFGEWYGIDGSYYVDAWRKDLHVIRPFKIPGHWPRFRVMDHGFKKPGTCLWVAVNEDGDLVVEREYNFKLTGADDIAKRIRSIEEDMGLWDKKRNESKIKGYADHNLWEERDSAAESKAEIMAKLGVKWIPADKADKAKNAQRFYKRLTDHGDGTTMPGIVFFEDCRQCIKTIPGIPADPNDPEVPAKVEDDHWHDAVLYACAARAKPANDTGRDYYEDDDREPEESDQRQQKRGSHGYGFNW